MKQLDKQAFIEAKAKGKNNTEAALEAGAINRTAAHKAGYRLSKDVDIRKRVERTITKQGITLEDLIRVFTEAMQADKVDRITGDITPDYSVRMKAADKLLDLSGIATRLKHETPMSPNIVDQSGITEAMKSGDEVELQKAVFRKA